jgi:pimeloyl-ACP methyl ester carboxylesterase
VPELERAHRVHNVDLMGAGAAAAPPRGDYSPEAHAARVAGLLNELSVEGPPVLVGHSLGGGIAVLAALSRVRVAGTGALAGLVLVSGAVYAQRFPRYMSLARIRGLGELFLLTTPPWTAMRWGIRTIVHDAASVDREMVDLHRAQFRSVRRRWAAVRGARQIEPSRAGTIVDGLHELDLPTLLVWGEEDRVVPLESARRLAADLPQATLVTLPGVGHLPPEEAPRESLASVTAFLRALPRGPA